jgi:hypothetical protein
VDYVTQQQWRTRILENLADEGVDVELTENQLDAALRRALEMWNKYQPVVKWFPFQIMASQTVTVHQFNDPEFSDRDKYPDTWINTILNVQYQDNERRILGPRAGFLEGYYLRWGYEGPRLFFALHVAERTYERLTGSIPDWIWDPGGRVLYLSSPSRNTRIMVLASRPRNVSEIPIGREYEFLQAATARAKYILSRTMGSMGDIPGPAGAIRTDHDVLRQEAAAEWDVVEKQLAVSLSNCPPPQWIG